MRPEDDSHMRKLIILAMLAVGCNDGGVPTASRGGCDGGRVVPERIPTPAKHCRKICAMCGFVHNV